MGQVKANRKKRKQVNSGYIWSWKLLPLQIILSVLPLVLSLKISDSGFGKYPWNSEDDTYLDIFLHGKMVVFLLLAAVILCLTVYKLWGMDKQTRKESLQRFAPLWVYGGLVLLSTVFSKDLSRSFFGSMDAMEPVTVLLGYVITVFYAYLVVESSGDVRHLIGAAVAGSACMAVIGVLQAVGRDPLLSESVQRIFAGNSFVDTYGLLQLAFPEGMAYGTLFNPNYVGTYVAIYAPLLLAGILLFGPVWKKAIFGAAFLGLLVMLFASRSRTGLIAVIAVTVVAVVFTGRSLWKRWFIILPGLAVVAAAFLLVDANREFLLINRLKELLVIQPSNDPVQGVDTTGDGVRVLYKDTEFLVMMPVSGSEFSYMVLEGEEPKQVTYDSDKTYGYFSLNNGDEIVIQTAQYENRYAFGLEINGRSFYFTNQLVAGDYKYINNILGRLDECVIPANAFPGYETVGSGRGYVWGRTLPLLLKHLVVGSGPDTFALEFPQNDYVARYRCGFDNTIFTRPHNMYLQTWVQTGALSLIAFLVFYITYFVGSCRRYCFKKYQTIEEWMGFALFLSTVGFLAAGLANDSLLVVSPVFYVLLGVGTAVNQKLCPGKINERMK